MGDSWRHILTYIQVGASNRNKAGGGFCYVKLTIASNFLTILDSPHS